MKLINKKENQMITAQTAQTKDRNNTSYLISCYSDENEDTILKRASDFYDQEMIAIKKRSDVSKLHFVKIMNRYLQA